MDPDDFKLILASFAAEYPAQYNGIFDGTMKWGEFCYLLSGLSAKSPIGRIVMIRSENDPEMIKNFTPAQQRIRAQWRAKQAKKQIEKQKDNQKDQINMLISALQSLAGGGSGKK